MESIISDRDAMDPEVVVGGGDKMLSSSPRLWRGLPQWALATFVVSSVAVSSWNFPECVAGLAIATLIICLRGVCGCVSQTAAGAWLLLLHQCCHLAGAVAGVRATLQYMAGHSSWLTTQIALSPRSTSLAVLAFIVTLHALGLERSRILRWGLLACIPITLFMIFIGQLMIYSGDKAMELIYQQLPTLSSVADSAAFFSLVFSSSLCLSAPNQKFTFSSFFPIKAMFVSCFAAIGFLSLALIDIRNEAPGDVLFFKVLEERGSGGWRMLRGGLAVASMTSLSLSLVELVSEAQRGVVGAAGAVLPLRLARDHWWTGTQLTAISITGLASAALVFLPLKSLVSLSSAGYLLSQSCDIVFTIYTSYQPSFVPKNCGTDGGPVSYQLLSDTAPLVEGNTDSESELSDDSGHSSDTDIDAAVHEYKQTVKVTKATEEPHPTPTLHTARITILSLAIIIAACFVDSQVTKATEEPHPTPTLHTARITILSLAIIIAACFAMAAALAFGHTYILFFSFLGVLFVVSVIARQPQESDGGSVVSPWLLGVTLTLQLTLAALLLPSLWAPLAAWVCIGLASWLIQKRRHLWHLQTRLSRHSDRVRLPRPQLMQNFQPSYHKLSTLDTVHIVR